MFLWCVGGPEVGSRILNHPKVDSWMMTGFERNHLFFFVVFFIALFSGCATFDAIVWGGKAAKESKNRKQLLSKTCHAELGAASPYIISPGNWTDQELDQQATLLAGYKMLNSGHVCASPQSLPSFIVFFFLFRNSVFR
jgi:acyl-CoA reductase-like NAD-dependent aldehyde dehydrogenase